MWMQPQFILKFICCVYSLLPPGRGAVPERPVPGVVDHAQSDGTGLDLVLLLHPADWLHALPHPQADHERELRFVVILSFICCS